LSLELLQLIAVYTLVDIVKAKEGGFGEDILEVGQLFLKERVLGRETSILLVHFFLDLLKLAYSVLQLILVVSLSHSASDCAFSVLQSSIRMD
jgi:hypothetical protein